MELKDFINKKTVIKGLNVAKTLGKAVLWEGVKGVALKSTANLITTSFEQGVDGVKKMTLNDYVGSKKKTIERLETKSKETKVIVDGEFEVVEEPAQT